MGKINQNTQTPFTIQQKTMFTLSSSTYTIPPFCTMSEWHRTWPSVSYSIRAKKLHIPTIPWGVLPGSQLVFFLPGSKSLARSRTVGRCPRMFLFLFRLNSIFSRCHREQLSRVRSGKWHREACLLQPWHPPGARRPRPPRRPRRFRRGRPGLRPSPAGKSVSSPPPSWLSGRVRGSPARTRPDSWKTKRQIINNCWLRERKTLFCFHRHND